MTDATCSGSNAQPTRIRAMGAARVMFQLEYTQTTAILFSSFFLSILWFCFSFFPCCDLQN
uniref:Uncharacterized protein n=1 Tax=Daphnia magna TaxID=35525 RepID=A0A0P6D599_9CRUS